MNLFDLYIEIEKLNDFDFILLCGLISIRLKKIYNDKDVKL